MDVSARFEAALVACTTGAAAVQPDAAPIQPVPFHAAHAAGPPADAWPAGTLDMDLLNTFIDDVTRQFGETPLLETLASPIHELGYGLDPALGTGGHPTAYPPFHDGTTAPNVVMYNAVPFDPALYNEYPSQQAYQPPYTSAAGWGYPADGTVQR